MDWHQYFMSLVFFVSMKSKDKSTHIGCVIAGPDHEIRSTGFNGLARGVEEKPERQERPLKYLYYAHAERNAIYNAARMGLSLKGCHLYTNGIPCTDCAIAVIQSGISEVTVWGPWHIDQPGREKWNESSKHSMEMFKEAGVQVFIYDSDLIIEIKSLRNGQDVPLVKITPT